MSLKKLGKSEGGVIWRGFLGSGKNVKEDVNHFMMTVFYDGPLSNDFGLYRRRLKEASRRLPSRT